MRIQPIDAIRHDVVMPPVLKSRLKRLFDRPFNSSLRNSSVEFEPSSVCLDKMVQNFIEDNNEKQSSASAVKCGRHRCNCFNGKSNDSSDDEFDLFSDSLAANSSFTDPCDGLTSLIPCVSVEERNLLADTSRMVEKSNKICKRNDELRKVVTDGLIALGYNASVCKSKWEKTSSIPAGEHEYIDVITEGGERLIIDVDFRSEFEIARSTSGYKAILQCLPSIFVGKSDRLLQIIVIASEAARHSLKKKGMHIAPWRKAEYVKSKWLGPHTRTTAVQKPDDEARPEPEVIRVMDSAKGELRLSSPVIFSGEIARSVRWQLPELRPKSLERGNKLVVTGLAALLKEKL
ncbi:hypothetical protein SASPL_145501 [Salvia splendens]|uniref:Uncharacterized protein n=1 Tax=Salvia splendens TaxID=180675 RepID=A0A8X8WHU5_SALSN|nr:uncharacterized protein LOC121773424 [Salvia splendens]KAG6394910.1 hypothetical protein SASPL_145501 [Salvia splendens]